MRWLGGLLGTRQQHPAEMTDGVSLKEKQAKGPIRVANVIEDGRYGGPQIRILSVSERLLKKGINTTIICPEKEMDRFYEEALERGLEIRSIPMNRLGRKPRDILKYVITFPGEMLFLRKLLRNNNIHIVHCNSARQFKGVAAGRLSGKRVVWHLQDTFSPALIRILFFMMSSFAHCFIVAGKRVQQYYLGAFPFTRKPVTEIQAPVDTAFFVPKAAKGDPRIASLPGANIVSVGNVNPAKGYEHLIDAASCFSGENEAVNFWIVGGAIDSQKNYYDSLLKRTLTLKNVHFYGTSTDVRSVLEACDVYVCASIHEASPISVWEAMSMGKGIVSTDVGDVSRFIEDGQNGFVVPAGSGKVLAEKIRLLLKQPGLRERFGKKARETAIERLDVSVTVKKHIEVYYRCLNLDGERRRCT